MLKNKLKGLTDKKTLYKHFLDIYKKGKNPAWWGTLLFFKFYS